MVTGDGTAFFELVRIEYLMRSEKIFEFVVSFRHTSSILIAEYIIYSQFVKSLFILFSHFVNFLRLPSFLKVFSLYSQECNNPYCRQEHDCACYGGDPEIRITQMLRADGFPDRQRDEDVELSLRRQSEPERL